MKTTNENQNATLKLKRVLTRKRVPSRLDPFTEQLLQMDTEKKTLKEMMEWLKVQRIETSDSTLSDFLISRRRRRELRAQFNGEKGAVESFLEWNDENPNPTLEAIIERFKMLALSLSVQKEAAPEVLKLADRLAGTASRVANDQSRAEYRTRKLLMEEAKHAEWIKCEQTRALELCLDEAKKNSDVAALFRQAFAALKAIKSPALRQEDGPQPMPASCARPATTA